MAWIDLRHHTHVFNVFDQDGLDYLGGEDSLSTVWYCQKCATDWLKSGRKLYLDQRRSK